MTTTCHGTALLPPLSPTKGVAVAVAVGGSGSRWQSFAKPLVMGLQLLPSGRWQWLAAWQHFRLLPRAKWQLTIRDIPTTPSDKHQRTTTPKGTR